MRIPRIFVDARLASGAVVALPEDTAHYLRRVLRLTPGSELVVFDGRGEEYAASLSELGGKGGRVLLGERSATINESPLTITLLQGLCRGQRMDYCVQKATELGVHRIVAACMERSVVRLDERKAARRVAHWRAIAVSACEQSGRARVPDIVYAGSLDNALAQASGELAMLDASGEPYERWPDTGDEITLCVGPEGGYGDGERERLSGAQRWRLGPRILRTETAGIVALSLAQARWGDLR